MISPESTFPPPLPQRERERARQTETDRDERTSAMKAGWIARLLKPFIFVVWQEVEEL